MYRIVGQYRRGDIEDIDTAEGEAEAHYLATEYALAFGADWQVWVETDADCLNSQE